VVPPAKPPEIAPSKPIATSSSKIASKPQGPRSVDHSHKDWSKLERQLQEQEKRQQEMEMAAKLEADIEEEKENQEKERKKTEDEDAKRQSKFAQYTQLQKEEERATQNYERDRAALEKELKEVRKQRLNLTASSCTSGSDREPKKMHKPGIASEACSEQTFPSASLTIDTRDPWNQRRWRQCVSP
jgi:hypothetical protein